MLSLIYVSVADTDITQKKVEALAIHSARNNADHNVTGLLAYDTRRFMQLLEGDEKIVLAIMRQIESDSRHTGVSYVRREHREHRECPTWSMQSLIVPGTGLGSADIFAHSLPTQMAFDTKVIFTSFASSLHRENAL